MTVRFARTTLLIVLAAASFTMAQVGENPSDTPQLQHRCSTVAVVSEIPGLSAEFFSAYLLQRPDFQASKMELVGVADSADAVIRLGVGPETRTRIVVTNRWTQDTTVSNSIWSGFPGMIAMDAMRDLAAACPGSVRDVPYFARSSTACSVPIPAHTVVHSISACSHTSWMDNRQLDASLQKEVQLTASAVRILHDCSPADAQLKVSHNLNETEEWSWELTARDGELLTKGRVVAFRGKDVAGKIARLAVREIAASNGGAPRLVGTRNTLQPLPASQNFHAKWLPYDLKQHDTQLTLYYDAERVSARDRHGNLVFDFSTRDFRDARLTREWSTPLALDDPTDLIEAITVPEEAYGVMAYLGIGAVLAQIKLPWHSLELAWERDGIVNTVALEVSAKNGKQLIRDLQSAASAQQPFCESGGAAMR